MRTRSVAVDAPLSMHVQLHDRSLKHLLLTTIIAGSHTPSVFTSRAAATAAVDVASLCRGLLTSSFMSDRSFGLARYLELGTPDRDEVLAASREAWSRHPVSLEAFLSVVRRRALSWCSRCPACTRSSLCSLRLRTFSFTATAAATTTPLSLSLSLSRAHSFPCDTRARCCNAAACSVVSVSTPSPSLFPAFPLRFVSVSLLQVGSLDCDDAPTLIRQLVEHTAPGAARDVFNVSLAGHARAVARAWASIRKRALLTDAGLDLTCFLMVHIGRVNQMSAQALLAAFGDVGKFPAGSSQREGLLDALQRLRSQLDPVQQQSLFGNISTMLTANGRALAAKSTL
jgi:hypothetical protein